MSKRENFVKILLTFAAKQLGCLALSIGTARHARLSRGESGGYPQEAVPSVGKARVDERNSDRVHGQSGGSASRDLRRAPAFETQSGRQRCTRPRMPGSWLARGKGASSRTVRLPRNDPMTDRPRDPDHLQRPSSRSSNLTITRRLWNSYITLITEPCPIPRARQQPRRSRCRTPRVS